MPREIIEKNFILEMLMEHSPILTYLFSLLLIGLLVSWWLVFYLKKTRDRRLKRLNAAGEGLTGVDNERDQARMKEQHDSDVTNIMHRFALMQRILIPAFWIVWLFAGTTPVLSLLPSGYLSFVLGLFTAIIGIAAQPFLENVIAGMVISISKRVRLQDTVIVDGKYGTIEHIALTYSVVKVWNWTRYIIPNSSFVKKEIINYSLFDTHYLPHVEFWVSPQTDLQMVEGLCAEAIRACPVWTGAGGPKFWVMEMGQHGIRCWTAGWTLSAADGWQFTHDVRTYLAKSLQKNGIRFTEYALKLDEASSTAGHKLQSKNINFEQ